MSTLAGFTVEQASKVTGLSIRQLRYWDSTGFFPPGFMKGESSPVKLYTFRDLVGLRALAELRKTHRVPLQELRKTAKELLQRHETPWASLTLYVSGRRVFFDDPDTGVLTAGRPGRQAAFRISMQRIANDTESEVERLRKRGAAEIGKVSQKRNVVRNQPVVAGTRVPTSAVWNLREAGFSISAIRKEYPRLTPADVRAAVAFERNRRKAG